MKNSKQNREVAVGRDARENLLKALGFIAEAVGSTMGPGGRPFGFDKRGADMRLQPSWSKDGLTVLKSLGFDDPAWEAVLSYAKQAASHSVVASGDGTTSTIVLANAVAQVIHNMGATALSPQAVAREIEDDAARCVDEIRKDAFKSDRAVRCVALTSTNGDEELTDVVLEAINNSGAFGTVLVEKNPASAQRYKIVKQDGYSNCGGYNYNQTFALSAHSNAASSKPIEWDEPKVLIWNGSLVTAGQIDPILAAWNETLNDKPANLVIVAFDIADEVANKLLVANRTLAKHNVGIFVVKPRLTAEVNSGLQVIRDIAAFCGVQDDKIVDGGNYKDLSPAFFGTCRQVKIAPGSTMFLGRSPDHWVEKRVQQNQSIVEEARSQFDKQITSIRNAELAEGLVKVEVGGGHLADLQERADRFDDAAKAAQSCMWHGAVPGGGLSYIRAGHLAKVNPALGEALLAIHETVLSNYGAAVSVALELDGKQGFKLLRQGVQFGDAVELGVLDAVETVCAVIRNGVALGVKVAILGGYSFRDPQGEAADD